MVSQTYSKEIALFQAKSFLITNQFVLSSEIVKFEAMSLAADIAGELTTLAYKCESQQKEGLILGFYGTYWNDAGVVYQGYGFKNFDKEHAVEFLDVIQKAVDGNSNYLQHDWDNNFCFKYDDVSILVSYSSLGYEIRLMWNDFDSDWSKIAFDRTKRMFERKIK